MTSRNYFLLCFLLVTALTTRSGKSATSPTASAQRTKSKKSATSSATSPNSTPAESRWVNETLRHMTLEQKLGQMLVVYYFGNFISDRSPEYLELIREVEHEHVGGLILGTERASLGIERGGVYQAAVLGNDMQRRAKIPLIIGADFERGTAMRIDEGTSFPFAMAIGAAGNPRDAYTVGKITAIEARAAGVHWVFAPDADVNNNPDNPIINTRSFGEDPQRVSEFVAEFVRGVQENGALATAKHFPGHGDVSTDSHLSLPTVSGNRARLESVELVPFRGAIAAGVGSIMTGHLAVPAFESNPNVPATMSHAILTDLLRHELDFHGLIVTDALDMGGVTTQYPPGEAAVRSVEAGADVLLLPPVPTAALKGLIDASHSGRLPMSRIDDAVRRILTAKARLGLEKNRTVDVAAITNNFARPEYAATALDIASRGITLLRDKNHVLPLDATKPLRLLAVQLSGDSDPWPGENFEDELRHQVDNLTVLRADTQFHKITDLQVPDPSTYDAAIICAYVRVSDRKGNVDLPAEQVGLINRLLAAGKPVIVAAFGTPYLIDRFPDAPTWIASFSTADVSQRAMARALVGTTPIAGHIPVTVPGTVNRGDGLSLAADPETLKPMPGDLAARLAPAYEVIDDAIHDHAFPGAVVAIGYKNQLDLHAFGHFTYDASSPADTPNTIFDLASITKPFATVTSIMMLAEQDRLDVNLPLSRYLPEWLAAASKDPNPTWRANVTVRQVMLHTAGLPAVRKFFEQIPPTKPNKDELVAKVLAEPLEYQPGTKVEYSDLGMILMGEVVERLTGQTLDEFAKENIFEPLALKHTMFKPAKTLRAEIAPTEDDEAYRHRQIQGEVHDENAYAMGGVAGHAGAFSTAGDLAVFAQMLLNGGIYAHHKLLKRATIDEFTTRVDIGTSARTMGWDVPVGPSSSGKYFSLESYGHTGFTGTSIWIDPEKQLFVILFTNRVYPTRENNKIRDIRPRLADAVVSSLGLATSK